MQSSSSKAAERAEVVDGKSSAAGKGERTLFSNSREEAGGEAAMRQLRQFLRGLTAGNGFGGRFAAIFCLGFGLSSASSQGRRLLATRPRMPYEAAVSKRAGKVSSNIRIRDRSGGADNCCGS